jgi:hypothetical protein
LGHRVFVIGGCSILLAYQHTFICLERYRLKQALSVIRPLLVEYLNVLTRSLLNFNVCVVRVAINELFHFGSYSWESDCQLRQRCECPRDNNIRPLAFPVIFIEDIYVSVYDLFRSDLDALPSLISRLTIDKHLTELSN